MEIGPIPGIRALGAVRASHADLRPPTVFDIDGAAKPGDGAGQQDRRKATGAEENDDDELTLEGDTEVGAQAAEVVPTGSVDYFA